MVLREFRRDSVGRGQHSSNWFSGISTRTMHQSTTPSLSQTIWSRWASRQFLSLPIVQTLLPMIFAYSQSSEAVMRQLRRWKRLWRRWLTHSHKMTSMGPSRSSWNGTTSVLQPEEITLKGTRVSCVYYQSKCPYEKSLETYLMILILYIIHTHTHTYPTGIVAREAVSFPCPAATYLAKNGLCRIHIHTHNVIR